MGLKVPANVCTFPLSLSSLICFSLPACIAAPRVLLKHAAGMPSVDALWILPSCLCRPGSVTLYAQPVRYLKKDMWGEKLGGTSDVFQTLFSCGQEPCGLFWNVISPLNGRRIHFEINHISCLCLCLLFCSDTSFSLHLNWANHYCYLVSPVYLPICCSNLPPPTHKQYSLYCLFRWG